MLDLRNVFKCLPFGSFKLSTTFTILEDPSKHYFPHSSVIFDFDARWFESL